MERSRSVRFADAIRAAIDSALAETHTALPARVVDYDPAEQTITARVELLREFLDVGDVPRLESVPDIPDVPVIFPRAGGYALTFPIVAGDPCLLLFAERDVSGWVETGDRSRPPETRRHAYSDAVALLGFSPRPERLSPAPAADGAQLRSDDGSTFFEAAAAGLRAESSGIFAVSTTGAITLTRGANELLEVISTALGVIAAATVSGVPLDNAAAVTTQKARVDAIRS